MSHSEQEIPAKKSLTTMLSERLVSLEVDHAVSLLHIQRFQSSLMESVVPLLQRHRRWHRRILLSETRIDALRDHRDVGSSTLPQDNTVAWSMVEPSVLGACDVVDGLEGLLASGLSLLLPGLNRVAVDEEKCRLRLAEFAKAFFSGNESLMRLILDDVRRWPMLEVNDDAVARIRHAAQLRRLIKDVQSRQLKLQESPLCQMMESAVGGLNLDALCKSLQLEIEALSFAYMGQQVREAQLWGVVDT